MSGSEPLNPYESPVIPDEDAASEEPIAFSDEFIMTDAGLLASARMNSAPIHRWVILTAPLWLLGLFVGLTNMVGGAVAICFVTLTLVTVTLVQAARDRHTAMCTFQLLQAHPVFGANGRWRLSIAERDNFLETPGGRQAFTFDQLSFFSEDDYRLLIWFADRLPIVIPQHPTNATMIKHLRPWIAKATSQNQLPATSK
jgi:hypothetical protein